MIPVKAKPSFSSSSIGAKGESTVGVVVGVDSGVDSGGVSELDELGVFPQAVRPTRAKAANKGKKVFLVFI